MLLSLLPILHVCVFAPGCGGDVNHSQYTQEQWRRDLASRDQSVRKSAIRKLGRCAQDGEVDKEFAVHSLTSLLDDGDIEIRVSAAMVLSLLRPDPARLVPVFGEVLERGPTANMRMGAACMLATLERKEAVPHLLVGARDPDPQVRGASVSALGAFEGESQSIVDAVVAGLEDPDSTVRKDAASAAARIRPSPPEIMRLLRTLVQDPSPEVRKAASNALENIRLR